MSDRTSGAGGLSASQLQRVDAVCDRFETALRAGAAPAVDDYLHGCDGPEGSVLARELRALARAYAPHDGGAPQTLVGAFPQVGSSDHDGPSIVVNLPGSPSDGVPQRFGDYELLDKLGQGGMGEVFRARQLSANRIVVLKIIRRDRLEDLPEDKRRAWVERFGIEARTAAQMEHENIVPVYQVGEIDGRHYYSMRFIQGHSLGELLQQGPLPPMRAATYMEKVARAVHHAHGRGILHRDIKPRNIIIDEADQPFVTDFGLAKWLLGDSAELTGLGALVGSPPYIAPEQVVDPSAVTIAADVYSLGATIYHLLTGRPPFLASSVHETLRQAQYDDPVPPRRLEPGLNRDLDTICLKCLLKDPRRRYATALDLADDLRRYLNREPIRGRQTPAWERGWRWVKRHPAAGVLYIVLALAAPVLLVGLGWFGEANAKLEGINAELRDTITERDKTTSDLERSKAALEQTNTQLDEKNHAVTARETLMRETAEGIVKRIEEEKLEYLPEVRKAFLLDLVDVYEKLCLVKGDDPDIQRETARAYRLVGKIRELLGEVGKAEQAFTSAVHHLKPHDGPTAAHKIRHELAVDLHDLGVVRMKLGKIREAEGALLAARKIRRRLAAESHAQRERCELATSYYFLGLLWVKLEGRRKDAAGAYEVAHRIQERLIRENPDDPDFQRDLARTLDQQAILKWKTGRRDEADQDFRRAVDLLEKLARDYPNALTYRLQMARTCMDRGDFLGAGEARDGAQEAYKQTISILDRLSAQYPTVPDYRLELAAAHFGLAAVLAPTEQEKPDVKLSDETIQHYRKGQTLLEQLDAEIHEGAAYERRLAALRSDLGFGLMGLGFWSDADKALRAAIAAQQTLTDQQPRFPDDEDALGKSLNRLARLQLTRLHPLPGTSDWLLNTMSRNPWFVARVVLTRPVLMREALAHARHAARTHQKLITEDAPNPIYREHLRDDIVTETEVQLIACDHAGAARAAQRLPDTMTEPRAVAQENIFAAEVLALCVQLAQHDPTLAPTQRKACADAYAQRAVGLLRNARAGGWHGSELSPAFRVLLGRKDFKALFQIRPASH